MKDDEEWTGTAGELWKALSELVDEDIRHSRAWPGAPNALSGRLKRQAPALRGIGIEYEDTRLPGESRQRAKRLRKYNSAKDRPDRPDRSASEEGGQIVSPPQAPTPQHPAVPRRAHGRGTLRVPQPAKRGCSGT